MGVQPRFAVRWAMFNATYCGYAARRPNIYLKLPGEEPSLSALRLSLPCRSPVMRFEKDAQEPRRDIEPRQIERAGGLDETLAPRDWTTARVEAWLDWSDGLARDFPQID